LNCSAKFPLLSSVVDLRAPDVLAATGHAYKTSSVTRRGPSDRKVPRQRRIEDGGRAERSLAARAEQRALSSRATTSGAACLASLRSALRRVRDVMDDLLAARASTRSARALEHEQRVPAAQVKAVGSISGVVTAGCGPKLDCWQARLSLVGGLCEARVWFCRLARATEKTVARQTSSRARVHARASLHCVPARVARS
jgi:hypothetical protein